MKAQRQRIAAYGLIHDDTGRLLLCRLSKEVPKWSGYWTLPGGGLNFGEAPADAMVREVEEETGLHVRPTSIADIDSVHSTADDHDFHSIRIVYFAQVVGGHLRHETSGSTDRCEWHDPKRISEINLVDLAEVGLRIVRPS
jgi:ADP-ribose pyrophosphatase YjhB (NUDIX family)